MTTTLEDSQVKKERHSTANDLCTIKRLIIEKHICWQQAEITRARVSPPFCALMSILHQP